MAEDYEKIKQAGADLIAISVDDQSHAWSMGQTTGAKFNMLSDSGHKVIDSYGVLNAAEHDGVAHPSIFIIGKDSLIKYLYVGKSATDRPSDGTIIEEVNKLSSLK